MERFICPDCGKVSYSADTRSSIGCPYCTEKLFILSNQFSVLLNHISHARLIFDRRQGDRRGQEITLANDRRIADIRQNNGMVIGWVIIKKKDRYSETSSQA